MYKKFSEYKETKEILEFGQRFDELCNQILDLDISFDEFWAKDGLPTILEQRFSNEDELLEGLMGNVARKMGQGMQFVGNMANKAGQWAANQGGNMGDRADQTAVNIGKGVQQGAMNTARGVQQGVKGGVNKTSQTMSQIKNAFNQSMQSVANRYLNNKDSAGYKLAQSFVNKVNSYADQMGVPRQGNQNIDQNAGQTQQIVNPNSQSNQSIVNPNQSTNPALQTQSFDTGYQSNAGQPNVQYHTGKGRNVDPSLYSQYTT